MKHIDFRDDYMKYIDSLKEYYPPAEFKNITNYKVGDLLFCKLSFSRTGEEICEVVDVSLLYPRAKYPYHVKVNNPRLKP